MTPPPPKKPSIEPEEGANKPDIFEFMDYRQYLLARLEYLQTLDRKYSQRWVAKRAGIKSPQLLTMIIKGQRQLNRDLAVPLAAALKMDEREAGYFRLIVDLALTESDSSRQELLKKINALVKEDMFTSITPDGAVIFREWFYPAIREIVMLKDFRADPTWISERLQIEPKQAEDALKELLERGFLRDEDGSLTRTEPSVRTSKNKLYPMYLGAYHLKILNEAFRGVRHDRDKRHFEALTVSIPKALMPRIKQEIQKFFREIDTMCESEESREEVVQLHMSMFPLTIWNNMESSEK